MQCFSGMCLGILVLWSSINLASANEEVPPAPTVEPVLLSNTELAYLNERLQTKDHLCWDDAINAIVELEHFYTLIKHDENPGYSPSAMVDLAWHQHILHTTMYSNFSREHFGIDFLHHLPFWSGNIEEVKATEAEAPGKTGVEATYKAIVDIFGAEKVNATVWLGDSGEHDMKEAKPKENIEL